LQRGKAVIPVEIKSGNDYRAHPALSSALRVSEWNISNPYVFCKENVSVGEKITYLPWYMVMFLKQERLPEHLIVNVNLKNL